MDKAARIRWTVLSSALLATVAAILYPLDHDATSLPLAPPGRQIPSMLKPLPVSEEVAAEPEGDQDPFAPRGWVAPPAPPPPAPAAQPQVAAVAAVAPPPATPPLPYRFVGGLTDGGEQLVYLGRGEEVLVARQGEVLEMAYKVLSINSSRVEFEYMPTGQTQTLALPARDN